MYPRLTPRRLLIAGGAAFVIAVGLWLGYALTHSAIYTQDPVDLGVYLDGGKIARHAGPYNGHLQYPLYEWAGATSLNLPFTYTPFAAVFFLIPSLVPAKIAPDLSQAVNILLLVAALWFTFRGLGVRDRRVRTAAALLATAATLWLQPVLRTMYLGQVNLFLMALIMWDMTQPATYGGGKYRWWRGWGTGVAAGIKMIPIVFVPYLLVARRFRDAVGVVTGFVATIALGFLVLPKDSSDWWFKGLFDQASRTGFIGWTGNQSLRGLITRLSGSIAGGTHIWYVAVAITLILGSVTAAILDRHGHLVPAILVTSLMGLLVSPISWDHHWVWAAPAIATLGYYGLVRFWEPARAKAVACLGAAAVLLAVFWAWPDHWFKTTTHLLGKDSFGLLWLAPNTQPKSYEDLGDKSYYVEYHFHGLTLIEGNLYVLTGMAALVVMLLISLRIRTGQRGRATDLTSEDAECVPAPHSAPTT